MIVAYCDHCGCQLPPDLAGGVRFIIGRQELSGHLCSADQALLGKSLQQFFQANPLRQVKP